MKKKDLEKYTLTVIILIVLFGLVLFTKAFAVDLKSDNEIKNDIQIISLEDSAINSFSFKDDSAKDMSLEELIGQIDHYKKVKENAHILAEYARDLGWSEYGITIQKAKSEHYNATLAINFYQNIYNQKQEVLNKMKWSEKRNEYPVATYIWEYLKNLGYNDFVVAGIIGNIMTEVGGQTLNLNPTAGTTYYGICQWNKNHKKVQGVSLEKQCDYLRDTIKYEIDTYGFIYKKNFNFNSFLELNNYKESALAFAKCYERCNSSTYNLRQKNAEIAYDYFVN